MQLTSDRYELDSDPAKFSRLAVDRGWGDGLPLIPPTANRVEEHVIASGLSPETIIARLPPAGGACTVERVAINAVMAGTAPAAMPLLLASVAAMAEPDFELHALSATTASVVPAVIVNGAIRHDLGVSFGAGCLGGADGNNAAIGRALRLILRNVGGHRIGITSQSVFGQPGRIAGIVFGEWEERSPWPPLCERRGFPGNAVTVFGAMGTMNMLDTTADRGDLLLDVIGRSLAYPSANGFLPGLAFSEVIVGINPVWVDLIAHDFPSISDVETRIWQAASLRIDSWPAEYHQALDDAGRIDDNQRVHLMKEREGRILIVVCGGLGGLHGLGIHGFGTSTSITRSVGAVSIDQTNRR